MNSLRKKDHGMNDTRKPQAEASPAKAAAQKHDFSVAIETMDSLSQEGFQHIMAIAKLALLSLESPDGHRSITALAYALEAIHGKAEDAMTSINFEAEKVACPWRDEAYERRGRAAREAALHS